MCRIAVAVVVLLVVVGSSSSVQADSVQCGRNYAVDRIDRLLASFERAHRAVGFVVTKKTSSTQGADFWATMIVPGSEYQSELRVRFSWDPRRPNSIHGCGAIHEIRQPARYTAKERNAYVARFGAAMDLAAIVLSLEYPR